MGRFVLVARLATRDLRRRASEAVLLLVAIAVASTTLTLGLLLHGETNHPYNQTRTATAGPDVVASVYPVPNATVSPAQLAALTALNHAHGVIARSGPYPVTWTTLRRGAYRLGAEVEGRDLAPAAVDQPKVTNGSWLRPSGAVVERTFAQALGVHVGDTINLGGTTFQVDGIAVTAAFTPYPQLCTGGCALTTPQLRKTKPGLIWLTRADAQRQATDGQILTYYDNLKLSDPATARAFADAHNAAATSPSPSLQAWQEISAQDADLIHDEQTVMLVGSWLLAALAVATTIVLVGTRLSDQTHRVGLLKAVGGT